MKTKTPDLTKSQLRVAGLLDELLDQCIKGDFNKVLELARQIHLVSNEDRKKIYG